VQRQYSGTAGRIENCQLGVFLTYVSPKGRALIDRELYLPVSWTKDRDRCGEAGIDDDVEFATKPELARRMLARLLKQGIDIGWFTADEAYGDNPALRAWLEAQQVNYVMAISCNTRLNTPTGPIQADELAAMAPKRGWQRLSAGAGSKGQRLYDWLLIDPGADAHPLLVRRSISSGELAYYIVGTTSPQPLAELVRVAGSRWGVEETLCATRRSVISPVQPGGTWKEVPESDGLPSTERLMGTRACQETSGRVQTSGTARWETRATW
jgi:SRSO17 transposase